MPDPTTPQSDRRAKAVFFGLGVASWTLVTQLVFALMMREPINRGVGTLELMAGTSRAPFFFRGAILRGLGKLAGLGPEAIVVTDAPYCTNGFIDRVLRADEHRRALSLAFGAQTVAFGVTCVSLWIAMRALTKDRALAATVAACMVVPLFFAPSIMIAYDPFVLAASSVLLALFAVGNVPAFCVALFAALLVKETLPLFGAVAAFALFRAEHRKQSASVVITMIIALAVRLSLPKFFPDVRGTPFEFQLVDNLHFNGASLGVALQALVAPAILTGALAFGWKEAEASLRLGVLGVTAFGAVMLLIMGRVVEPRIWLEYLPWCMAVAAPRIARMQHGQAS